MSPRRARNGSTQLNTKVIAATAAFVLFWIGVKLWIAPPSDVMAVVFMIVKLALFGTLFYQGVTWLSDKLAKRLRTD